MALTFSATPKTNDLCWDVAITPCGSPAAIIRTPLIRVEGTGFVATYFQAIVALLFMQRLGYHREVELSMALTPMNLQRGTTVTHSTGLASVISLGGCRTADILQCAARHLVAVKTVPLDNNIVIATV